MDTQGSIATEWMMPDPKEQDAYAEGLFALVAAHLRAPDGLPPSPFKTALLGYAAAAGEPIGTPSHRLIDPDYATKLDEWGQHLAGLEEFPRVSGGSAVPHPVVKRFILLEAAFRNTPGVRTWAVFDVEEHVDVYTLHWWWVGQQPTYFCAMPDRIGTWADLWEIPKPAPLSKRAAALARHPGPWRNDRAPILSAMPFQIARRAMLATARTAEWAAVDNVAVYRRDDTRHGNILEVQRRCDGAAPDTIFGELAAVAGDGVADTYAATVARIIEAGAPAEGVWINVNDVLRDRDLQPIRKRPGGPSEGYRTEDRLSVGEHFDELKRWHITGELGSWQGKRSKKARPLNIHSDLLTYTDLVTQTTTDGREVPVAVRAVLGEYARHFLANGAGRQTALLMRQALHYDPHNEQIEKRLAYHLAFYWRQAAHDRTYNRPMRLRELFQDARIETDGSTQAKNVQRTIDRYIRAFDTLRRDGVIANYELLPGKDDAASSKLDRWLDQRIRFTPPEWAPEHYYPLGKHNPAFAAPAN